MLRYYPPYQQPTGFAATLTHPNDSDQLVPEYLRSLDQNMSIVSGRPRAMPSEPSVAPINRRFADPIASPEMYYHPIDSLIKADYVDGNNVFPYIETVTPTVIPAQSAFASSSATSLTAQAHAVQSHSESELASPSTENDPATDSLPLCRLHYGAWKCMLCGQKLRRKQRAIVHYWSKHSTVRLSCSGRCGLIGW
jgi:hypothetical protein